MERIFGCEDGGRRHRGNQPWQGFLVVKKANRFLIFDFLNFFCLIWGVKFPFTLVNKFPLFLIPSLFYCPNLKFLITSFIKVVLSSKNRLNLL